MFTSLVIADDSINSNLTAALLGDYETGEILYGYNIILNRKKKVEWKEYVENLSNKLDEAGNNLLMESPIPLTILSNKGNIIWYNQKFSSIFKGKEILGSNINDVSKNLNVKHIIEGNEGVQLLVTYFGRSY